MRENAETENAGRKHRQKTHRQKTQREHTERKRTEHTHRENTDRKHTQTENPDRKQRKHRQKTHREKTQTENTQRENTEAENTERKHRQKTQRENTQRKTQGENTDRKQRYQLTMVRGWWSAISIILPWSGVGRKKQPPKSKSCPMPEKIIFQYLFNEILVEKSSRQNQNPANLYYKVLHGTPRRSRASSPGPPASKANALSARQIFWDGHVRKIVIANKMRGAILQILCVSPQFRAVDPPGPPRGFIRQNQNVRFATAVCHPKFQNERFATAARTKMYETSAWRRRSPAAYKNHRFTTVSDVRPARSDERVARPREKFAFPHSFERPTSTK